MATKNSKWKTLAGKLKVPFFKTNPLMLNNVPITIELYRQKPEFALIDQGTVDRKLSINIRNPILTLARYKPATESLNVIIFENVFLITLENLILLGLPRQGIRKELARSDASYFYKAVELRYKSLV